MVSDSAGKLPLENKFSPLAVKWTQLILSVDHDIDIFALTETWLEPGDSDRLLIEELIPSGYRFFHNPRSIGHGGGVGMLFKNSLRVKQEETIVMDSFEYMQIILRQKVLGS